MNIPHVCLVASLLLSTGLSLLSQTFTNRSTLLNPGQNDFTWGCSAADINNDGYIDIYESGGTGIGKLYLNRDGASYEDILPQTGLEEGTFTVGGVFGDWDNDGFLDVFFIDFSDPGHLFRYNHLLSYEDVTAASGILANDLAEGSGWADADADGWLDLFVGNDAGENQLFRNIDGQQMDDISLSAGVQWNGHTYGAAWGDYNNDRLPDIFLTPCSATDPTVSIKHLLRNNGDLTFTNENVNAGVNDSLASWGVTWLDYDNDGYLDIYIGNSEAPPRSGLNRLYRNNGDGTFSNTTEEAGAGGGATDRSFGVAAADFDNDGWIDIYVANSNNGHKLLRNNGNMTFSNISLQAGITESDDAAVSVADFNRDGWPDIFTAGSPANRLMINDGGSNHWIAVQARGITDNYYGIGARIEISAGGLRQIREIHAGDSYCSQNDRLTAHFGLGATATVDTLICYWPNGSMDLVTGVAADRYLTIVQGVGINTPPETFSLSAPADGDTINNSLQQISFNWEPAVDPEGESIEYLVTISGATLDTVLTSDSPSLTINPAGLLSTGAYSWTVSARDSFSIRASRDVYRFYFEEAVAIGTLPASPAGYRLMPNFPNPFNPQTTIAYELPTDHGYQSVRLTVYTVLGQEVITLVDDVQGPGHYRQHWNGLDAEGKSLTSGIYWYALSTPGGNLSGKMVLLR